MKDLWLQILMVLTILQMRVYDNRRGERLPVNNIAHGFVDPESQACRSL